MILIADSGSTKTDWMIVDQKSPMVKFNTAGFNPYFHDEKFILSELQKNAEFSTIANSIDQIYFFGAGCSSAERNKIIVAAFKKFFAKASINVDTDMIAAVRATCGDLPGTVCILGTGSNCCYFDGVNIVANNFGLGYVLADEGGGSYFGRKIITAYLYDAMPPTLKKKFDEKFEMTKEIAISNVYGKPRANVWLASFSIFLSENKDDLWIRTLVKDGIREFLNLYILSNEKYKNSELHFVGSIAYYFDDLIRELCKDNGLNVKSIIHKPISHLAEYYLTKISH